MVVLQVGCSIIVATTTPIATTNERPQQLVAVGIKRGPIIAILAPEPSTPQIPSADIHIMSTIAFQAMALRLSQIEA